MVRQNSPAVDLEDLHQELARCSLSAASVGDELLAYLIKMALIRIDERLNKPVTLNRSMPRLAPLVAVE